MQRQLAGSSDTRVVTAALNHVAIHVSTSMTDTTVERSGEAPVETQTAPQVKSGSPNDFLKGALVLTRCDRKACRCASQLWH